MSKDTVSITLLPGSETIVIKKGKDSRIFILTSDSIIISKDTLLLFLDFMVKNNILSEKSLEIILAECSTE